MNTKAALLTLGLLVTFGVSGCQSTEYVPVKPQCQDATKPDLPHISRGELWDALGDEQYRRLEAYIDGLWAYADERGAIIREVCDE